jgi:hypothetical protein
MKKFTFSLIITLLTFFTFNVKAQAQEEEGTDAEGLQISGSVDTYYKYDFSGNSQIPTSFIGAQNSFGIGMVDLALQQSIGKASFVGEVAFGPRADASAPGIVQNLYVSYQLADKLSVTGGFMSTYIGYEVISPVGNFNYTTSYLFSNGPFQQGGLKLDYAVSDRFGVMVGVFNQFDSYFNSDDDLDLGAQLYFMPTDGFDIYLNFVSSNDSGTEIDLTTTYQLSDAFMLGLNVADRTNGDFFDDVNGGGVNFFGTALYAHYAFSNAVAIGFRGEHFTDDQGSIFGVTDTDTSVDSFTLSGNIGSGPLKLIPEFRVDISSEDIFTDGDSMPTGTAGQFILAAYYAF